MTAASQHPPRLDYASLFASRMSERELDQAVRDLAKWLGVRCYSVRNSSAGIATSRGYPDLTLCGPRRIAFRELKTVKGKLTPEQTGWGEALTGAGQDWKVWRPGDLIARVIEGELRRLATTTEGT